MSAIAFLALGLAVSFNFIVIIAKYRKKRYLDATLDMSLLALFCILFSGTFSALVTGTIASMFVSFYLYFRPVTFEQLTAGIAEDEDEEYDEEDY